MEAPDALEVEESEPQVEPEHPAPESVQETPLLPESFRIEALIVRVPPVCTLAEVGFTLTVMAGGGGVAVTVKVAEAALVVSVTDLALSVTVAGDGTFA